MSIYREQLFPWKVVQLPPNPKKLPIIVANCRTESDAKGQLAVFKRANSSQTYEIKFVLPDLQAQGHGNQLTA